MSKFSEQLKLSAPVLATEAQKLVFAEIADLMDKLPDAVKPLVIGIEAAIEPSVKAFLDAKVAELVK